MLRLNQAPSPPKKKRKRGNSLPQDNASNSSNKSQPMFYQNKKEQQIMDEKGAIITDIHIVYNGTWNKATLAPTLSLVCMSVFSCSIIMASRNFSGEMKRVIDYELYRKLNIGLNINLISMPHGGDNDKPENCIPILMACVEEMREFLKTHKQAILVNCHNGRSRTGTLVALFLIIVHEIRPDTAIKIISAVLNARGVSTTTSLNIKTQNPSGSYGDWLQLFDKRHYDNINVIKKPEKSKHASSAFSISLEEHKSSKRAPCARLRFYQPKQVDITDIDINPENSTQLIGIQ